MKLLALIKKEFRRFFGDPKLIIAMLLPGILIYVIYSLIGTATAESKHYDFKVYLQGTSQATELVEASVEQSGWTLEFIALEAGEEAQQAALAAVKEGKATAILSFSENFDGALGNEPLPAVRLEYDAGSEEGGAFAALLSAVLQTYEQNFTFTPLPFGEDEAVKNVMAGLLPFLIVVFVFSACMSVTLESVAGEKERGTLATILVTSARRSHIALGKVLPLSCVSLIGAASSFLGVMLSMPRLMGISMGAAVAGVGAVGYVLIFLLIVSFVPLIVGAIAVISTLSRSVKEASGYTGAAMIVMMLLSLAATFVSGLGGWVVAVPILNAVTGIQGVLSGSTVLWQCLVSVAVNLAYTALLVLLMARLLSSERVMFGK